ncbi:MAG TPA: oligosaccharide flippase family protein [Geminicoccaceae bacterium]|nr:oligosaccharide flippase family protein [Geminicoccaceae bacterium]
MRPSSVADLPGASATHRTARGAALHLGAQLCLAACGYIIAVLLARGLGPAAYGVFGLVYSVLLSAELAGRLGIPQAVSKLIAERRGQDHAVAATGTTLSVALYLLVFAGFWLGAPRLEALLNVPDGTYLFRVAAIDIPFYGLFFMLVHVLNGRRDFGRTSLATALYGISKVIGILVLVTVGPTIEGALIVNVVGSLVALSVVVTGVGREVFVATLAKQQTIMALAVPIALMTIGAQVMLGLDLWMLSAIGKDVADQLMGQYVAAANLAKAPNLLAFAIWAVLIPSLSRATADRDRDAAVDLIRGTTRFVIVLLLPACTLVAVNGHETMTLLFTADYAGGGAILEILIFGQGLCYTVFMTFCAILIGCGRARTSAVLALAVLPVAILSNLFLIGRLGALGAALASLLTTAAAMIAAAAVVQRITGPLLDVATLSRLCAATLALAVVGSLAPGQGILLLVELLVLGLVFALLVLRLGLLERQEIDAFLPTALRRR